MKRIGLLLPALALAACATSSHILVGDPRPAITPQDVRLYVKAPARYEVIALVHGSSVTGWTQQQDTDNAIASMKKEAAKLGANGVLLNTVAEGGNSAGGIGISSSGASTFYAGGYSSKADLSGQAIYVPPQ